MVFKIIDKFNIMIGGTLDTIADGHDIDIILGTIIRQVTCLPFTPCTKLGQGANGAVYSIAPRVSNGEAEVVEETKEQQSETETETETDARSSFDGSQRKLRSVRFNPSFY